MDKRKTIYKLRDLRACIFFSFINLLFGTYLLAVITAIPRLILSKIEESLLIGLSSDTDDNVILTKNLVRESNDLFYNASIQFIVLSIVALIAILLLIRLNGKLIIRRVIAGTIISGISLINFASIMIALRFMNSASHAFASQGYNVVIILGYALFLLGLSSLFFKTLMDLTKTH